MKNYFKDWLEITKQTGIFYKKHWLGTFVFELVTAIGIIAAIVGFDKLKEKIQEIQER